LHERADAWSDSGIVSVRALGDAWSPGTIAAAVWDGRRYAEELDGPGASDAVPFLREVVSLAERP
jgi:dimethylamine/trimethylamine dehydrogenase